MLSENEYLALKVIYILELETTKDASFPFGIYSDELNYYLLCKLKSEHSVIYLLQQELFNQGYVFKNAHLTDKGKAALYEYPIEMKHIRIKKCIDIAEKVLIGIFVALIVYTLTNLPQIIHSIKLMRS